jgi:PIN domain nuclease of toxin-antitoxin system
MQLLLDSHILLWAINDSSRLGPKTYSLLSDTAHTLFVSAGSLWELGLKHAKGKLPYSIEELCEGAGRIGSEIIPITVAHIQAFPDIVLPHKDPFDTLLVAQAVQEDLVLVTSDTDILSATSYPTLDARL